LAELTTLPFLHGALRHVFENPPSKENARPVEQSPVELRIQPRHYMPAAEEVRHACGKNVIDRRGGSY